jgi:nicotinate-nucleotide adenylyltransferase
VPPLRLGVFGGTFSPPHVAHLAVAEAAREQGRLDRVLWVPAAVSPFKQGEATPAPEHRLEMTRLATADHPAFEVSDVEVARGGVSYTVDTLAALADAHPKAELYLVLGGDSLASFPRWREPERILALARLLVYRRPGDGLAALPEGLAERTTFVEAPGIKLASTEVRALIRAGRSARYLVPEPVRTYIRAHGLYRAEGT